MSKTLLQIFTAILAAVPLLTGILSLGGIHDPLYRSLGLPEAPVLDSNLRFFGGLWLGFGFAVAYTIPAIEQKGTLYRFLWLMIFIGGIGRLLSLFLIGLPPVPFIAFTLLEIIGAPAFIYWQWRVARSAPSIPLV